MAGVHDHLLGRDLKSKLEEMASEAGGQIPF